MATCCTVHTCGAYHDPSCRHLAAGGAMRILLVEDDDAVAGLVVAGLAREGFCIDRAVEGRDAFHRALDESYDLIILVMVIPHIDGLALLGRLRKEGSAVPVLILPATDSLQDRVAALTCGAAASLASP